MSAVNRKNIASVVGQFGKRLLSFIRRRVDNEADAEDEDDPEHNGEGEVPERAFHSCLSFAPPLSGRVIAGCFKVSPC